MIKQDYPFYFFILLLLLILYFFFNVFKPFLLIFVWASILVTTCYPVYRRLLRLVRGREGLASTIMVIGITLVIILPISIVIVLVARESMEAYHAISAKLYSPDFSSFQDFLNHPYVQKVRDYLPDYIRIEDATIKRGVVGILQKVSTFLMAQSQRVFSSAAQTLFQFFLLLVATFYFFKDGRRILEEIRKLSPLDAVKEEKLIKKFSDVVQATMLGNFITGVVQGILGGIGFMLVGLPSPVLWGTIMAIMALVPIVGAFLIWIPASVYLFSIGSYGKGIFLVLWGSIVVGLSDNFLKPLIIQGRAKLHPVIIFFSILGGLAFFGFSGLILGPLITALTFVFLEFYREEFREQLPGTVKLYRDQLDAILKKPDDETPSS